MNRERLDSLLNLYFDQSLTDAESAELQELLSTSDGARNLFWLAARWHALLWNWAGSNAPEGGSKPA